MKLHDKKLKGIFLIFLAAFLGGGTASLTKITAKEIPPFSLALLRFIIAGIIMIPFLIRNNSIKSIKHVKELFLVSLLATANILLYTFGVRITSATVSQMLYLAVPLVTAILSFYILKEPLKLTKILGICIGLAGTLIVLVLPIFSGKSIKDMTFEGNILIMIAVLSFSLYSVLSKRLQSNKSISPIMLTLFFILTTIASQLFLAPLDLIYHPHWWEHVGIYAILGLFYIGIISTGLYYFLYQYAIKISSPIIASMILYLQPFFTYVWAYILLKEKLSTGFIVGMLLALIGVALTNYSERLRKN